MLCMAGARDESSKHGVMGQLARSAAPGGRGRAGGARGGAWPGLSRARAAQLFHLSQKSKEADFERMAPAAASHSSKRRTPTKDKTRSTVSD